MEKSLSKRETPVPRYSKTYLEYLPSELRLELKHYLTYCPFRVITNPLNQNSLDREVILENEMFRYRFILRPKDAKDLLEAMFQGRDILLHRPPAYSNPLTLGFSSEKQELIMYGDSIEFGADFRLLQLLTNIFKTYQRNLHEIITSPPYTLTVDGETTLNLKNVVIFTPSLSVRVKSPGQLLRMIQSLIFNPTLSWYDTITVYDPDRGIVRLVGDISLPVCAQILSTLDDLANQSTSPEFI